MPTFLNLTVKRSEINAGVDGHCTKCPWALALNRALKPTFFAVVGLTVFQVRQLVDGKEAHLISMPLPDDVIYWILEFDKPSSQKKPLKPITMKLGLHEFDEAKFFKPEFLVQAD